MKRLKWVVAVLLMLGACQTVSAALLAYDGFVAGTDNAAGEYVANPGTDTSGRYLLLEGQNPILDGFTGEWKYYTGISGVSLELGVTPISSLSYGDGTDSVATSGNAAFRKYLNAESSRALDMTLGTVGTVRYISFLMQLGDTNALGQIDFGLDYFENVGRLRIKSEGGSFVANAAFNTSTLAAADTDAHLFVWKITYGDSTDSWELFMDPVSLANEASNSSIFSGSAAASLNRFDVSYINLVRGNSGGTGGNGVMFDEIRIGDTWNDVTTVAPGPLSFSDTFESYTAGNQLGSPWVVSSTSGSTSTVNVAEDQSAFSSGTNAINYYDASAASNPKIEYDFPASTTNPLSIQFDFKLNTGAGYVFMQLEGEDGFADMFLALTYNTSVLRNYTDSSTYDTILDTDTNVWYHVDILTSAINESGNETFDITVTPFGGSATTVSNLVFRYDVDTAYTRLQFMQNAGSAAVADLVLDNVSIAEVLPPSTPYEDWAQFYSLSGADADYTANPDGDRLNNLYEWALGGDPTDEFDQGISPTFGTAPDGSWFLYTYPSNALATDLVYFLETDTDLVSAPGWTNDNYEVLGVAPVVDGVSYVTNRVSTTVENQQFIRLVVEESQ
jgi:hypothetical protein